MNDDAYEVANRHAIVMISYSFLQEISTVGWQGTAKCVRGLPEGARLVSTFTDDSRNVACLVFEHDSFEPVEAGDKLPILPVVFETVAT